jgi:hypothetical protein
VPDRRRRIRSPQSNSLVAAAQVMLSPNQNIVKAIGTSQSWQNDAWDFYDSVGEFRFGISWIANAMSRVNLVAAMPPSQSGDEPTPIDLDDPRTTATQRRAIEIISTIADGAAGQGMMLGAFGLHLSVAGVGWLVVEPDMDDFSADEFKTWQVLATDEIRQTQSGTIELRVSDRDWRTVHPNSIVIKVWRKHPRWSYKADAPTRGVLSVLREIDLLTKHIHATAQSRLAGAGLLAIPSEAVFPSGQGPQQSQGLDPDDEDITAPEDTFVETLIEAMTVPLTDRGSAASVVPLVVKVPGEQVDKIKHISFATPFDDRVLDLLNGAIRRLALGLDIPPEILTGTSAMNHWGAWQVAEEAITLHIEPLSETIVNALTIGYLRPALEAEGLNPDEAVVWYDTSDLRTRPDRSASAVEAYDRVEISAEAMLREMGLGADSMPSEEEKKERILLQMARSLPALAPYVLEELGYLSASDIVIDQDAPAPRGDTAEPDTSPERSEPDQPSGTVVASALAAACDIIVRRALERAGSRLRSAAGKKMSGGAAAIPCADPSALHCDIDATEHADLATLLDGAWTIVPEIAERYKVDAVALEQTLDAYTRALMAAQQEHRYGRLAIALGAL